MLFNYSVLMPTTDIPAAVDTFARDTVEAAAMLRQMGVQKVALVGGSVGGLSALRRGWTPRRGPTGSSACRDQARPRSQTRSLGCGYQSCSWRPVMTSQPSRLTDELYGAATSGKSRKLVLVDGALVCLSSDDFGALAARSPYDASWASARGIPLPHR
jgi:hypothetical protein